MLTLPNEIIAAIVGTLPHRARFALATSCRVLHYIAVRELYHTVFLDDFNILTFLRGLYCISTGTLFAERCRLITNLSVAVCDVACIARSNPYLCTVLRSARNLRSFSMSANGFSGKILFMFLSRSGLLPGNTTSAIPTLQSVSTDTPSTPTFLKNLSHLHIGSSLGLIRMATGRNVESIGVSRVHHLRSETVITAIHWISDAGGKYLSLRKLSFAMVVDSARDILIATDMLFSVCENLNDLEITAFSVPDHIIQGTSYDDDPDWPTQIRENQLSRFSLTGNMSRLVRSHLARPTGEHESRALAKDLGTILLQRIPSLKELIVGQHQWLFVQGRDWKYANLGVHSDMEPQRSYSVWRFVTPIALNDIFEEDETQVDRLPESIRRWRRRERSWEQYARNGDYWDTGFDFELGQG